MDWPDLSFDVSEEMKVLLSEQRLAVLVEAFAQLDRNQDGKIGFEEFASHVLEQEKARLQQRFATLDMDRDGSIEFEEFVIASEPNFQILRKFRELDLDQNGLLSLEEAVNIANQLIFPVDADQVAALIRQVDRDGDGQVT